jgi:spore cortex formation protein SpoVR/YcgB (stage V sporulation)
VSFALSHKFIVDFDHYLYLSTVMLSIQRSLILCVFVIILLLIDENECREKSIRQSNQSSAQIAIETLLSVANQFRQWITFIRNFILEFFASMFEFFGSSDSIRRSTEVMAAKTWTAIKEQLPEYMSLIFENSEQLFLLMDSL